MTTLERPPLIGMDFAQLEALCRQAGAKSVHAERLRAALFRRQVEDVDAIPDLPATLRSYIAEHTTPLALGCIASRQDDDGTTKLLLSLSDGAEIESVLIPSAGRLTQCVSTQVGCAVGCGFCLTASAGLTRNLTAAEMVAQVLAAQRLSDKKIRNLVLMGMGEPLHNYAEVAHFVRIATDPKGMAFSPNRVTLSTAGLVPGIRRMIAEDLPCNLALSLNATTDAVRDRIMPINRKYPIAELMQAVRDYIAARGNKRVLIEYVLLAGVNDSPEDARRLSKLLAGLDCTVNLLPFNAYAGAGYNSPTDAAVSAFRAVLVEASMVAVVRESRGREISAACGQLRTEVARRRERAACA